MRRPAINLWQCTDGHNFVSQKFTVTEQKKTMDATSALLSRGAMKDLYDYDNYLDNTENDWTNSFLNMDVNKLLSMY